MTIGLSENLVRDKGMKKPYSGPSVNDNVGG